MIPPTPQSPSSNAQTQTLAETFLARGQFAEAVDKFGELLQRGLQTPVVYRNLMLALLGLEDCTESALQIYQHVLELFPNDRELCIKLCKLLLQNKARDTFALKHYQQTLALNPPPEREVLWALALHLQEIGYEPAAFEILKRLAMRENGNEPQTLARLAQLGVQIGKQNEVRNVLVYLEGRNERALGVPRVLALDYAQAYLRHGEAAKLSPREWRTITQVLLNYEGLERLSEAREYATLRLALARVQSQSAHRQRQSRVPDDQTHFAEFLKRLSQPAGNNQTEAPLLMQHVYGMRLSNLAQIGSASGETIARNLGQKFIGFAMNYLTKVAHAKCFPLGDGLLVFSDSLKVLAISAVDLLHKIERYNLTAAKNTQLFAQTVMHSVRATSSGFEHEQLQILYETLHLLEAQNLLEEAANRSSNRLFFTRLFYERVLGPEAIPAKRLGVVRTAGTEFQIEAYEALWRNPLEYVTERTPYDMGRFVVTAKLRGSRTSGTYLARDEQLERNVILKALSPQLSIKLAQDAALRERVVAALKRIAQMESTGLATIYDMGYHEDLFFYAREYVEGQSLENALAARGRFTATESLRLGVRMCRALSAAHRQGVFHGNLKPANVWLLVNDELKLSDFYVPGFVERPDLVHHANPANWLYAAPELFLSFAPQAQSEIYAIGMMLYELLNGSLPFAEVASVEELEEFDLPALSSVQSDIPDGLDELLARACHKNPRARFKNLFEMESALRAIAM